MRTDSIETHRRRGFRGVDCGVGLCEALTCGDLLVSSSLVVIYRNPSFAIERGTPRRESLWPSASQFR